MNSLKFENSMPETQLPAQANTYTFSQLVGEPNLPQQVNAQNYQPMPNAQTYPSPPNMGNSLSSRDIAYLEKKMYGHRMDIDKKKYNSQIDYDSYQQKIQLREDIKTDREYFSPSIYVNNKGVMQIEKRSSAGKITLSDLCNIRDIKVHLCMPVDSLNPADAIYRIYYKVEEDYYKILLAKKDLIGNKLVKCVQENGVQFYISKKLLTEIAPTFATFICKEPKIYMYYTARGWTYLNEEWVFTYSGDLIWEDIENEYRKFLR